MSKRTSLTKNDGQVVRSEKPTSVELTIYKSGDAVVHESRTVELPEGKVTIQLEGLPANFVEDSFEISDASGPGTFKLGPDSFQPANLSSQALLAKAVGSKITLLEQTAQGLIRTTGTLRFVIGNQLVIEDANGIQILPTPPKFELESIPDGLSATPALSLEPTTSKSGVYLLNSMYETGGLSWAPRYAVFYDDKTGLVTKLRCRVKLTNSTGANYDDAVMKLLDANNTSRGGGRSPRGGARMASLESAAPMAASFGAQADYADSAEVGSVGEQKIYILPDKLSIKNGETKRPYLVVARDVPVKAELYVPAVYGYQLRATKEDDQKLPVFVRLRLRNDAESNLGSALPGGEVSVFQPDSTGKYQKTDPQLHIGAVAKGEAFKLELTTPSSDVKASRRLVSFHQDPEEKEPESPVTPEGGLEEPGFEAEGGASPVPSFGMRPAVVQGGPGVGTPGEHSRRRREVAEGAGKKARKEPKPRFREEQREITVYNFKDRDVQVQIQETLPHGFTWLDKTHELFEDSETSGVFTVDVPAGQSVTVGYGIRWKIN
ncbi:MAG: hypothetical protein IT342_27285 [Candidatus Melainabacteria bacterium]|nr:hypothetical protein [Candidatus Melainabacteria bacterium]